MLGTVREEISSEQWQRVIVLFIKSPLQLDEESRCSAVEFCRV